MDSMPILSGDGFLFWVAFKLPFIRYIRYLCLQLMVLSIASGYGVAYAANQVPEDSNLPDLTNLSMENLLELDVTSITKTATDVKNVPAAIYVLTADDIRRSGATVLPEVLRLVPGMHVARIDGNKWAVSTRGFGSQYAGKLLVLMDGRSLYTPTFSGVWWDQEDVLMEDIERIEVIRGPGASLWGANAVNGVINIISKKAKNTQGGLVSGQGGSMRQGGVLRYGVDLGKEAYLKVYGRYSEYNQSHEAGASQNAGDDARLGKLGFRYDKAFTADKLNLQGDVYSGFSGGALQALPNLTAPLTPVLSPPYSHSITTNFETAGHYLMGRWEHQVNASSSTVLRLFWSRSERNATGANAIFQTDTVDADFQHNVRLNKNHQFVWGLGSRLNINNTQSSSDLAWEPGHRVDDIYNAFAQDEITLVPEHWLLTLGGKFEHNPVTQFEFQPTARLTWTPDKSQSVWASLSRSVRTPNWADQDLNFNVFVQPPIGGGQALPSNPAILVSKVGNKSFQSERMLAYELGWRGDLTPRLTADVAVYYYDYNNLLVESPNSLDFSHIASGYVLQSVAYSNYGEAEIYGGEASLDWRVTDDWKIRASYVHTQQQFDITKDATVGSANPFDNSSPTNQALLWSQWQLNPQIQLDLNWRFVDGVSVRPQPVSSYHELDARVAWQFAKGFELALIGRNLLNQQHLEYGGYFFSVPTVVQREVYATVGWRF